jgi:nucleotide-binding universal stress UspA family protein
MLTRIVVGFDGSAGSRAALVWAANEARLHTATLVALTVDDKHTGDGHAPSQHPPVDFAERAQSLVTDYPIEFRDEHGPAAERLIGECRPSDLLVVGKRGHNTFTDLLLGSVSRACVTLADCPVTVVRGPDGDQRKRHQVLVGVDGSASARRALHAAAEEARIRDAALDVVYVVALDNVDAQLARPAIARLTVSGQQTLANELADISTVQARPTVLSGHPADVLVRHSNDADLLVVGCRGHNPLTGLLLGSTSDYCIRHAQCPVMVLR